MANVKSGYAKLGGSTQVFVIPAKAGIQAFAGLIWMAARAKRLWHPADKYMAQKKPPEISQQCRADKRSVIHHKPEVF